LTPPDICNKIIPTGILSRMGKSCIALLTDFGTKDYFVASLKGVILSINPECAIVDISHEVPEYDLTAAAFVLWACYRFFPGGTIFLTVVDPGVGSERRILLARSQRYYFIAPDNGVLSLVFKQEDPEIMELNGREHLLTDRRSSFEGRDKMAPLAKPLPVLLQYLPSLPVSPILSLPKLFSFYPFLSFTSFSFNGFPRFSLTLILG